MVLNATNAKIITVTQTCKDLSLTLSPWIAAAPRIGMTISFFKAALRLMLTYGVSGAIRFASDVGASKLS